MSTLTPLQKNSYINKGGVVCPHCGSSEIEAGSKDYLDNKMYQSVWCNDCEEEWSDEYTLTNVHTDEDE